MLSDDDFQLLARMVYRHWRAGCQKLQSQLAHPPDEMFALFLESSLGKTQRLMFIAHLLSCDRCMDGIINAFMIPAPRTMKEPLLCVSREPKTFPQLPVPGLSSDYVGNAGSVEATPGNFAQGAKVLPAFMRLMVYFSGQSIKLAGLKGCRAAGVSIPLPCRGANSAKIKQISVRSAFAGKQLSMILTKHGRKLVLQAVISGAFCRAKLVLRLYKEGVVLQEFSGKSDVIFQELGAGDYRIDVLYSRRIILRSSILVVLHAENIQRRF